MREPRRAISSTGKARGRRAWVLSLAAALPLGGGLACGSAEAPQSGADGVSGGNRAPLIEQLHLEPMDPIGGDVVRAVVRARDPDGEPVALRFDWEIDGVPAGEAGAEIELPPLPKGTSIAVTVTASDRLAESAPERRVTKVRNLRPTLSGVRIEPWDSVVRGEELSVSADATDPDGDALKYRYRWSVNGRPIDAQGAVLETGALELGDVAQVRVVASDGESESDPIDSARVRVVPDAPRIASVPSGFSSDGTFRYVVEVANREEFRDLRFHLRTGPDGMSIDPVSGEIRWRPSQRQIGLHPVEVEVKDALGTTAVQTFELSVGSAPQVALPPANQAQR